MEDPYFVQIATSELSELTRAFEIIDEHAELNHRYRALLTESREQLNAEHIRLTQARGLAKRLMVLLKAAGAEFPNQLAAHHREALEAGRARADDLVFRPEKG